MHLFPYLFLIFLAETVLVVGHGIRKGYLFLIDLQKTDFLNDFSDQQSNFIKIEESTEWFSLDKSFKRKSGYN